MSEFERSTTPAIDTLVEAMMQSSGQLTLIVDHMLSADPHPDADPIPDVLRRVLGGTLAPLAERHGDQDIATAAQMLTAATELIGTEVYLVPHANRAERRQRSKRRPDWP